MTLRANSVGSNECNPFLAPSPKTIIMTQDGRRDLLTQLLNFALNVRRIRCRPNFQPLQGEQKFNYIFHYL